MRGTISRILWFDQNFLHAWSSSSPGYSGSLLTVGLQEVQSVDAWPASFRSALFSWGDTFVEIFVAT